MLIILPSTPNLPPDWLSGGRFGVEGSIISIIVQLILIAYLSYEIFVKGKYRLTDKFDMGSTDRASYI